MAKKQGKKKGLSVKAKKVLIGIGVGVMVAGMIGMGVQINKLTKTKEVSDVFGWEIGLLSTEDGGEVKGTTSIRMKDYCTVDKFTVDIQEDPSVSYRVFFYNAEKEFISVTDELVVDYDSATEEVPEGAEYVRIMATPQNDPEVSTFEVAGYANDMLVEYKR